MLLLKAFVGVLLFVGVANAQLGAIIADVTVTNAATLILAGNAFRSALNCTNHSASVNVRWGGSTVDATHGQRLPAGSSITISNRAPIYMISEGANVTVSCTEETK